MLAILLGIKLRIPAVELSVPDNACQCGYRHLLFVTACILGVNGKNNKRFNLITGHRPDNDGRGAVETGGDARANDAVQGANILIVDDDANLLAAVRMLLEAVGAIVHQASNGRDAVAMLLDRKYDFVLMDLNMPVMDGISAVRTIRSTPSIAATRVVAMTGRNDAHTEDICRTHGMDGLLFKPFRSQHLFEILASL